MQKNVIRVFETIFRNSIILLTGFKENDRNSSKLENPPASEAVRLESQSRKQYKRCLSKCEKAKQFKVEKGGKTWKGISSHKEQKSP